MNEETTSSRPHLGGPLGLAGLIAMTAAAGGLFWVSDLRQRPLSNTATSQMETIQGSDIDVTEDKGTVEIATAEAPPAQQSPRVKAQPEQPAHPPAAAGQDTILSTPMETTDDAETAQRTIRPADQRVTRGPAMPRKANFIVRFEKDPELEACLDQFRTDQTAGRAAFKEWASQHPELSGMALADVSYSGEAILTYDAAEDVSAGQTGDIRKRLQSLDAVRYADPDYTAHPG